MVFGTIGLCNLLEIISAAQSGAAGSQTYDNMKCHNRRVRKYNTAKFVLALLKKETFVKTVKVHFEALFLLSTFMTSAFTQVFPRSGSCAQRPRL